MLTKKQIKAGDTIIREWLDVFMAIGIAKSNINPIFKIVLIPWCMDDLSKLVGDDGNYRYLKAILGESEEKDEKTTKAKHTIGFV